MSNEFKISILRNVVSYVFTSATMQKLIKYIIMSFGRPKRICFIQSIKLNESVYLICSKYLKIIERVIFKLSNERILKTRKRYTIICTLLIMAVGSLDAQSIKIGEKCPDVLIEPVVNYSSKSFRISDFKNKLLIFDFWATWCGPCIATFPLADSLEKQFSNQIVIMPVTYESSQKVCTFLEELHKVRHFPLSKSVTGDTALSKLFKHTEIPFYAWIAPDGTVAAITDKNELTEKNIRAVLSGDISTIRNIRNFRKKQNLKHPSFVFASPVINDNKSEILLIKDSSILSSYVISKYQNNLFSYVTQDSFRISAINCTISALYNMAAGQLQMKYMTGTRTLWKVSNPDLYKLTDSASLAANSFEEKSIFKNNNLYCYERRFPVALNEVDRAKLMLSDLNDYFGLKLGIHGSLQTRVIKCLVLERTTTDDKMTAKRNPIQKSYNNDRFNFVAYNKTLTEVLNSLFMAMMNLPPVVDETGYTGKVDIELKGDINHVESLNILLEKYGLRFIESFRPVDCIVISDEKSNDIMH